MCLDVVHIDRLPNSRGLVQVQEVLKKVGVLADAAMIAFEVHHIHLSEMMRGGGGKVPRRTGGHNRGGGGTQRNLVCII